MSRSREMAFARPAFPQDSFLKGSLLSDNSEQINSQEAVPLKATRGRSFAITWAFATVVATAGWLYLVFEMLRYFVSLMLGI